MERAVLDQVIVAVIPFRSCLASQKKSVTETLVVITLGYCNFKHLNATSPAMPCPTTAHVVDPKMTCRSTEAINDGQAVMQIFHAG